MTAYRCVPSTCRNFFNLIIWFYRGWARACTLRLTAGGKAPTGSTAVVADDRIYFANTLTKCFPESLHHFFRAAAFVIVIHFRPYLPVRTPLNSGQEVRAVAYVLLCQKLWAKASKWSSEDVQWALVRLQNRSWWWKSAAGNDRVNNDVRWWVGKIGKIRRGVCSARGLGINVCVFITSCKNRKSGTFEILTLCHTGENSSVQILWMNGGAWALVWSTRPKVGTGGDPLDLEPSSVHQRRVCFVRI